MSGQPQQATPACEEAEKLDTSTLEAPFGVNANKATGGKRHETALCYLGKIPGIDRYSKDIPTSKLAPKLETILSQTRVCRSLFLRLGTMVSLKQIGFLVLRRIVGTLLRSMLLFNF